MRIEKILCIFLQNIVFIKKSLQFYIQEKHKCTKCFLVKQNLLLIFKILKNEFK